MNVLKPFADGLPAGALRVSLYDRSEGMADAWLRAFGDVGAVEIVRDDVFKLRCDALVSPANSFGDMDGGLDKAIDDFFRGGAQPRVKRAIAEHFYGELPVGAALVVVTEDRRFPFLVVAPTMRVPSLVPNTPNAYLAMRAALAAVLRYSEAHPGRIRSLAVPGLCTGVGGMAHALAAEQMRAAYDNVIGGKWRDIVHSAMAPFALPGWRFKPR